jgi:hypothetical protein
MQAQRTESGDIDPVQRMLDVIPERPFGQFESLITDRLPLHTHVLFLLLSRAARPLAA